MNFNALELKKLIATCYAGSPNADTRLSLFDNKSLENKSIRAPLKIEISKAADYTGDGRVGIADVEYLLRNKENTLTRLQGDGDFRSAECVELMKRADVVVTNPPFSLFREFVAQLMEHKKSFLIVGNQNAITYRGILPLIRDNKAWLGYNNGHFWFKAPDTYEVKATDFKIDEKGQKWRRMGNICFFTNINVDKRREDLTLFRKYSPDAYPKYDDYDAIEVSRTADIPCDYYGVMGVPITFMQYYNPDQFIILGDSRYHDGQEYPDDIAVINGKTLYRRILIKRRRNENLDISYNRYQANIALHRAIKPFPL